MSTFVSEFSLAYPPPLNTLRSSHVLMCMTVRELSDFSRVP